LTSREQRYFKQLSGLNDLILEAIDGLMWSSDFDKTECFFEDSVERILEGFHHFVSCRVEDCFQNTPLHLQRWTHTKLDL
jgi:hypothetical protein